MYVHVKSTNNFVPEIDSKISPPTSKWIKLNGKLLLYHIWYKMHDDALTVDIYHISKNQQTR